MDSKLWEKKAENGEFLIGNVNIKAAIERLMENPDDENKELFSGTLVERMLENGQLIVPIESVPGEDDSFFFKTISNDDGKVFLPAFTDEEEFKRGPETEMIYHFIDVLFERAIELPDADGVVINPWGDCFEIPTSMLEEMLKKKHEQEAEMNPNKRVDAAIVYATEHHKGQTREGSIRPYIAHPLEVMTILNRMNADANLVIAGILHDTVRDTDADIEEIREQFGEDVAGIVEEFTVSKELTYKECKAADIENARQFDLRGKLLVLANTLSELRTLYADYKMVREMLWNNLKAPKEMLSWYYSEIQDTLEDFQNYIETEDFYWEMVELYKDLFVQFLYDQKLDAIYQFNSDTIFRLTKKYPEWEEYSEETDGKIPERCVLIKRKRAEHFEDNWRTEFLAASTVLN